MSTFPTRWSKWRYPLAWCKLSSYLPQAVTLTVTVLQDCLQKELASTSPAPNGLHLGSCTGRGTSLPPCSPMHASASMPYLKMGLTIKPISDATGVQENGTPPPKKKQNSHFQGRLWPQTPPMVQQPARNSPISQDDLHLKIPGSTPGLAAAQRLLWLQIWCHLQTVRIMHHWLLLPVCLQTPHITLPWLIMPKRLSQAGGGGGSFSGAY